MRSRTAILITIILLSTSLSAKNLRLGKDTKVDVTALKNYSAVELKILRASIYANYGYIFKTKWLHEFFIKQKWYKPDRKFSFKKLKNNDYNSVKVIQKVYDQKVFKKFNYYFITRLNKQNRHKKLKKKGYLKLHVKKYIPKDLAILLKDFPIYANVRNNTNYNMKSYNYFLYVTPKLEGKLERDSEYSPYSYLKYKNLTYDAFFIIALFPSTKTWSIGLNTNCLAYCEPKKWKNKYVTDDFSFKYIFNQNNKLIALYQPFRGTSAFYYALFFYYKNNIVFLEVLKGSNHSILPNPNKVDPKDFQRKTISEKR